MRKRAALDWVYAFFMHEWTLPILVVVVVGLLVLGILKE